MSLRVPVAALSERAGAGHSVIPNYIVARVSALVRNVPEYFLPQSGRVTGLRV